jgi:DNA-binding GntR family transcriptional regulator
VYTALHTTEASDRSLSTVVYGELKRLLLNGEFRIGRRLAEVALSEQLDVSRTPVREALVRLHAEGFVVRLPEGGFSPAAPDLHTIAELYVVRRSLEMTALNAPGGHDAQRLAVLRDDWELIDPVAGAADPDFVLQDEDFHVRLAEAAGNRALVEILTRVNERIRIVRVYDFLTVDRVRKTIDEHLSVLAALDAGQRKVAERRLNRHLQISRDIVEQRSAQALSRMVHGAVLDD